MLRQRAQPQFDASRLATSFRRAARRTRRTALPGTPSIPPHRRLSPASTRRLIAADAVGRQRAAARALHASPPRRVQRLLQQGWLVYLAYAMRRGHVG